MKVLLALTLMLGLSVSAFAQTEEQKNLINHLGDAIVIDSECSTLSINEDLVTMAGIYHHLNLADDVPQELLKQRIREQLEVVKPLDEEVTCMMGLLLFGKNGTNLPTLLVVD